ncbi:MULTISPECIES: TatD family hydrolase [Vibrio]|uniref:TatD family deoxyribonuclease n=1 Tax=Vibrio casei TaxID=673372 RepID=A0A368LPL6_9VIBR|nr:MULTISPECIES: TatD family hydrolase [Vibrio]RCS73755.1 TatD family deoxyribonuclease [Vibrio casei]SJN34760.1 Putative deoxyribonuclease YjjV [Vibrio casei]HBV77351.1 deoxyribonuclease [Vibrio sp.]
MNGSSLSLVDTHCHFDFSPFNDTQKELASAQKAGVHSIIIPSIGESNWYHTQQLAEQYSPLYYALGLHPYFIGQHNDNALEQLRVCLDSRTEKCVAVGECGLDFMLDDNRLIPELIDKQFRLFDAQIQLAIEYELPLILHARRSHDKVLQRLRHFRPKKGGVIHAFSGSYQLAMEYVKLGFYIGVGGVITYPRAKKTRDTIARLPISSLLLETDAPDMPLSGFQGQANHPSQVLGVFESLCLLRKEDKSELERCLFHNSCELFAIQL